MKINWIISACLALAAIACNTGEQKPLANADSLPSFTLQDAEADYKAGKARFLEVGLPTGGFFYDKDSLAKTFGFYYENLGNRTSDRLDKEMEAYNSKMEQLLEERNGKDWKKNYERKGDSLREDYFLRQANDTTPN